MNPYTVAVRPDGQDGCDFVHVKAPNAYEAQIKAKNKYRKDNDFKRGDIVYIEYTFAGHIEVLDNTYGFPTPKEQLLKL